MKTIPDTIDQAGVQALIRERLEHPELYADKPLFIWQAAWHDGVQQKLIVDASLDFNRGKAREQWSYFHLTTVVDDNACLGTPHDTGHLVGNVINPRNLPLDDYLRIVSKLIDDNKSSLPMIVYLPYRYQPIDLPGEQYVFVSPASHIQHPYASQPEYSLSLVDGVLIINSDYWLAGIVTCREYEWGLEREYESPFVHLDFHTAVIDKGIRHLCQGCFNGCKNLRKIILPHTIKAIETPIAVDTAVEYIEENGLLFLGSDNNPRLALMGCVEDYPGDEVVIPSDTKVIADNIDWPIHVKTLIYPDSTTIHVNEKDSEATGDEALPF